MPTVSLKYFKSSYNLVVPESAMFEPVINYAPLILRALKQYETENIAQEISMDLGTNRGKRIIETSYFDTSDCNSNFSVTYPSCLTTIDFTTSYLSYPDTMWKIVPRNPKQALRDIIKQRQFPAIHASNRELRAPIDAREVRARETLHLLLGEEDYRRFLRNGFVSVKNNTSGRIYQIFPGHKLTNVYENGKMVECLCVILQGDFPPTDSLIVRYLMVLNNEEQLWTLANKQGTYVAKSAKIINIDNRKLIDIYKILKDNLKTIIAA